MDARARRVARKLRELHAGGKAFFSMKAMEKGTAGKGRFFYLNLSLQDYARLRAEKTAPGFSITILMIQPIIKIPGLLFQVILFCSGVT